jgi:hypothetical protein
VAQVVESLLCKKKKKNCFGGTGDWTQSPGQTHNHWATSPVVPPHPWFFWDSNDIHSVSVKENKICLSCTAPCLTHRPFPMNAGACFSLS